MGPVAPVGKAEVRFHDVYADAFGEQPLINRSELNRRATRQ